MARLLLPLAATIASTMATMHPAMAPPVAAPVAVQHLGNVQNTAGQSVQHVNVGGQTLQVTVGVTVIGWTAGGGAGWNQVNPPPAKNQQGMLHKVSQSRAVWQI